ncbi:MAG: hydrogenase [Limisphaerales bacterium]
MNAPVPSDLPAQLMMLLTTLILVVQLMMVPQRTLTGSINLFGVQSLLLAGVAATVAYFHQAGHVWFVVALIIGGKVIALPWFLKRLVRRININQELKPSLNSPTAMLLCGIFTLIGYLVARPFAGKALVINSTFGIAIALMLMGFFLMINRRTAITQVLALLCAENGLFLAAIALTTYGMPLVVELGIFFDLFIAVLVIGILVYRIRETFASIDVERLNLLKG